MLNNIYLQVHSILALSVRYIRHYNHIFGLSAHNFLHFRSNLRGPPATFSYIFAFWVGAQPKYENCKA